MNKRLSKNEYNREMVNLSSELGSNKRQILVLGYFIYHFFIRVLKGCRKFREITGEGRWKKILKSKLIIYFLYIKFLCFRIFAKPLDIGGALATVIKSVSCFSPAYLTECSGSQMRMFTDFFYLSLIVPIFHYEDLRESLTHFRPVTSYFLGLGASAQVSLEACRSFR